MGRRRPVLLSGSPPKQVRNTPGTALSGVLAAVLDRGSTWCSGRHFAGTVRHALASSCLVGAPSASRRSGRRPDWLEKSCQEGARVPLYGRSRQARRDFLRGRLQTPYAASIARSRWQTLWKKCGLDHVIYERERRAQLNSRRRIVINYVDFKTGGVALLRNKSMEATCLLSMWSPVYGSVTPAQAFVRNLGTWTAMPRESSSAQRNGTSADASSLSMVVACEETAQADSPSTLRSS
jgi:hypothetical protein